MSKGADLSLNLSGKGTNPAVNYIIKALNLHGLARTLNILATSLTFTDGRDKSMKVIQYTLSVLMITVLKKHNVLSSYHKNIQGLMGMFGDARKIIRLANFSGFYSKLIYLIQGQGLHPSKALGKVEANHYPLLFIKTLSEFVNCMTDDLFCLSRFNVINRDLGTKAKTYSIKLWWTSLSIDLYFHFLKIHDANKELRQAKSLPDVAQADGNTETEVLDKAKLIDQAETKVYDLKVNVVKVLSDMIFCGYDLFHISSNTEYMHFAGIVSGYIGYSRLWKQLDAKTVY